MRGSQCRSFGAGQALAAVRFPLGFFDCSNKLKNLSGCVIDVQYQENIPIFLLET